MNFNKKYNNPSYLANKNQSSVFYLIIFRLKMEKTYKIHCYPKSKQRAGLQQNPDRKRRNGHYSNNNEKLIIPKKSCFLVEFIKKLSIWLFCIRNDAKKENAIQKPQSYNLKTLNFFKTLILTLRAIKKFKSRTKYRGVTNIDEYHLDIIDDLTFYPIEEKENKGSFLNLLNMNFIGKGIAIKIFRILKKKFKKAFFLFFRCLGNIFFFNYAFSANYTPPYTEFF